MAGFVDKLVGNTGSAVFVGTLTTVWGFTAMLLSTLLDVAGVAPPWDESVERELPERLGRPWSRG